jgi:phosphatidylglycerol:prolipoprotein diacylglycerol transferase
MLSSQITIGIFTFTTYPFLLMLAIVLLVGWVVRRANVGQRRRTFDVALGGLMGGLLLARLEHIILQWQYFQVHPSEILDFGAGGLEWHGAVIGAVLGGALVAHWRKMALKPILDRAAFGIPLLALAAWAGCEAALCAYGAEVATMAAYPPGITWEAMDSYGYFAPRFYTQQLGKITSLPLLGFAFWLMWRRRLRGKRFWLLLLLLSLSMFGIGFLRGDYALSVYALRLDAWFDLSLAVYAGIFLALPPDFAVLRWLRRE